VQDRLELDEADLERHRTPGR